MTAEPYPVKQKGKLILRNSEATLVPMAVEDYNLHRMSGGPTPVELVEKYIPPVMDENNVCFDNTFE